MRMGTNRRRHSLTHSLTHSFIHSLLHTSFAHAHSPLTRSLASLSLAHTMPRDRLLQLLPREQQHLHGTVKRSQSKCCDVVRVRVRVRVSVRVRVRVRVRATPS